jgi:hypothetical protein
VIFALPTGIPNIIAFEAQILLVVCVFYARPLGPLASVFFFPHLLHLPIGPICFTGWQYPHPISGPTLILPKRGIYAVAKMYVNNFS